MNRHKHVPRWSSAADDAVVPPSSGRDDAGWPRRVPHILSSGEQPVRAQHQKAPYVPKEPVVSHRSRSSATREALLSILIPVLIVVFIRLVVADIYVIPSGSMLDTLQIGDRIVTSRIEGQHQPLYRGDVIVFDDPGNWLSGETQGGLTSSNHLIKRIIGLPGDTVACKGGGAPITINGHAIDETSYLRPGVDPSDIAFSVKVTPHHLFVMGDNRANSADSRYHLSDGQHGLVPISDVQGVAKFVYWPVSHWRGLGRDDAVYRGVGGVPSAR